MVCECLFSLVPDLAVLHPAGSLFSVQAKKHIVDVVAWRRPFHLHSDQIKSGCQTWGLLVILRCIKTFGIVPESVVLKTTGPHKMHVVNMKALFP